MDHWAYPGLVIMRELGMAVGRYDNDYMLDDPIAHRWALQNRLNGLMRIINERTARKNEMQVPATEVWLNTDEITVGLLLSTVAEAASLGERRFTDSKEAKEFLFDIGILGDNVLQYYTEHNVIATNGQLMCILGALYNVFMSGETSN